MQRFDRAVVKSLCSIPFLDLALRLVQAAEIALEAFERLHDLLVVVCKCHGSGSTRFRRALGGEC
jgi:hypothetical protein